MVVTALNALRRAQFDVSDVRKEMSLARLDWTHRKVPTRSFRLAHIGVFAIMAAMTGRELC
jgi:hypothetical protein